MQPPAGPGAATRPAAYGALGRSSTPSPGVDAVLGFVRQLRSAGVPVSTGATLDAVRALALVDVAAREEVRAALAAAVVKNAEDRVVFDRLFRQVFRTGPAPVQPAGPSPAASPRPDRSTDPGAGLAAEIAAALAAGDEQLAMRLAAEAVDRFAGVGPGPLAGERHHLHRVLRSLDLSRLLQQVLREDGEPSPGRPDLLARRLDADRAAALLARLRALLAEAVRDRLLSADQPAPVAPAPVELEDLPVLRAAPDQLAALRAAVRPLARRLATRVGQRRRRRVRGVVDVRRTIRASLGSGGVPVQLALRRRIVSKPDLVVLCDVSGSVAEFAPFTLALLHALHGELARVRSFAFVDGVVEITDLLEAAPGVVDPRHLLGRPGLLAGDGRSDYARVLDRLLVRWPEALGPRTTVLIAGDGRSHDRDPGVAALRELAGRVRRLYWLDPEPRVEWGRGDSAMAAYAACCSGVFEASTLRQLTAAVAAIS